MPKTSANAERGMDGVEKAAILLISLGQRNQHRFLNI